MNSSLEILEKAALAATKDPKERDGFSEADTAFVSVLTPEAILHLVHAARSLERWHPEISKEGRLLNLDALENATRKIRNAVSPDGPWSAEEEAWLGMLYPEAVLELARRAHALNRLQKRRGPYGRPRRLHRPG